MCPLERTSKFVSSFTVSPLGKLDKFKAGFGAELIPLVGVSLADADRQPDAVPFPAAQAVLDHAAQVADQVAGLISSVGAGGECEDEDHGAEDGQDLAGLVRQERLGPLSG